jgi:DNA-binding transcriptional regulator YiaG
VPTYVCQREGIKHGQPICQQVPGEALDAAVGELLLAAVTPLALEVTIAIHDEVQARATEADRLRRQHVERARHEAELAQHRFLRVHPDNRLVADALEADWNARLRDQAVAQDAYDRQRAAAEQVLATEQRTAIRELAVDLPRLWRDPATPDRERKRLLRLLVDDVTLLRGEYLTAHVRFRGGASRTLTLALPLTAWQARQTDPAVVTLIDELLNEHTDGEIVQILNHRGLRSGGGLPFARLSVQEVRLAYRLPSRFARLRAAGYLTLPEMATALGVCTATVKQWRAHGLLRAIRGNDKGEYLYEPPGPDAPVKWAHKLTARRDRTTPVESQGEGAV